MAGKSRLQGDIGRFSISDFTHQNNIRVLANYCSQTIGKAVSFFRFNLGLGNSLNVVFNRVLNGYYLGSGIIQMADKSVKSGRLSGTGWPGGKNRASRLAYLFFYQNEQVFSYSQLFKPFFNGS